MTDTSPARKLIGVYGPHTPSRCRPDYYIDRDEARLRVRSSKARFINNNHKAIRMRETNELSEQRTRPFWSESASPGPATMERYISAGMASNNLESETRSAINGWRTSERGA
jgi:hypothetical protein